MLACNDDDIGNHLWHHAPKLTTKGDTTRGVRVWPPAMQALACDAAISVRFTPRAAPLGDHDRLDAGVLPRDMLTSPHHAEIDPRLTQPPSRPRTVIR